MRLGVCRDSHLWWWKKWEQVSPETTLDETSSYYSPDWTPLDSCPTSGFLTPPLKPLPYLTPRLGCNFWLSIPRIKGESTLGHRKESQNVTEESQENWLSEVEAKSPWHSLKLLKVQTHKAGAQRDLEAPQLPESSFLYEDLPPPRVTSGLLTLQGRPRSLLGWALTLQGHQENGHSAQRHKVPNIYTANTHSEKWGYPFITFGPWTKSSLRYHFHGKFCG